ncbi:MAG TPA: hypothetical protein VFZ61_18180 [Polyangiales bacterium]
MPERRDSWLARWTGADHLQVELERVTDEATTLRAELADQRALAEQQALELERHAREQGQLEEQIGQLAVQRGAAEQATRNSVRQALAAQERIDALRHAASQRDQALTQLQAAHDRVLQKNDTLEERLSRNEHELRTAHENLSADRAALSRAIEERSAQRSRADQRERELAALQRDLDLTRGTSAQQHAQLTEQIAAMSSLHQRALHEERQRWMSMLTGFWRALVRALGPTASVPLARELNGEHVLGGLGRANSPEEAAAQLEGGLRELSLCQQVSIASQGRELELRLKQPPGDGQGAQGWVGILAVQCLGSMLSRRLHPHGLHYQDGELVVRARDRERDDGQAVQA